MKKITVYEKPTCTTCRKVSKYLEEQGFKFEKINYYIKPFSKSLLKNLLSKMNMKPSELLRKKEKIYKVLKVKEMTENEILDAMLKHNDLIQRPIIEYGEKAILARPSEIIKTIFEK
ncbi:MAG: arsenate reductase [Bacteroidetes bacterium]|nr:arsenate reductase [Bacteroidota bacterium]